MQTFATEREWQKFHTPRNILLALVGEVGEVAEILQWKGEVAVGAPELSEAEREHLGQVSRPPKCCPRAIVHDSLAAGHRAPDRSARHAQIFVQLLQ